MDIQFEINFHEKLHQKIRPGISLTAETPERNGMPFLDDSSSRLLSSVFKFIKFVNRKFQGLVALLPPYVGFPEFFALLGIRGIEADQVLTDDGAEFLFKLFDQFLSQST